MSIENKSLGKSTKYNSFSNHEQSEADQGCQLSSPGNVVCQSQAKTMDFSQATTMDVSRVTTMANIVRQVTTMTMDFSQNKAHLPSPLNIR